MPDIQLSPRLSLHYLDRNPQGSPAVLLLHGLGADGSSWQLQFDCLEQAGFRLLAPDAPGFGHSTYPGRGSIPQTAEAFALLLQRLETGPVHVVGISMGGVHALQLALDHPELVRKLVLVNTFAALRPASLRVWLYFALRFVLVHTLGLPTQARAVVGHIFPKPEHEAFRQELYRQIVQADPAGYRAAIRALGLFDVRRRLGEIRLPTLVVTAGQDTTVPPPVQLALMKGIAEAQHVTIAGAGHAVIAEAPELFNQTLVEFLAARP